MKQVLYFKISFYDKFYFRLDDILLQRILYYKKYYFY